MSFSLLAATVQSTMDALSNGEEVVVSDQVIEEAVSDFREVLYKQFRRKKEPFRIRMSNVGRPLCQLQHEKQGSTPKRKPYNHIMRMMIGDAIEVLLTAFLKASKINITGGKDKVSLNVNDVEIKGESDIDIDGKVWDIKSSSPWAYRNKWAYGYDGIRKEDSFGYIGQLYGYSAAQKKKMGGWIVADKSSGEVSFIEAEPSQKELNSIKKSITNNVVALELNQEFVKCFESQDEYFNRKKTPNKRLHPICGFCDYRHHCWPDSVYRPQTYSKAQNPRYYWYEKYEDAEN